MNRAIWTLAFLAVTSISQTALAQSPRIQIRTFRVGDQVVGVTADQKLVGFACHFSAVSGVYSQFTGESLGTGALIVPNADGQLDFVNYRGSVRTRYAGSPYLPLTDHAFNLICNSTFGDYKLGEGKDGKLHIDRASVGELTIPRVVSVGSLDLRLVRFGDNILGATADQRVVGIACNKTTANAVSNFVLGSSVGSGVVVTADERNQIRLGDYQAGQISSRTAAPQDNLSPDAYVALCQGSWGSAHVRLSMQGDGTYGLAGSETRNIESLDEVLVNN